MHPFSIFKKSISFYLHHVIYFNVDMKKYYLRIWLYYKNKLQLSFILFEKNSETALHGPS
jgi:hypothetical protein